MAILENISVSLNLDKVRRRLHMKPDSDLNQVRTLVDTVQQLIEPRAIYNVCYIEEKSENSVVVGGLRLSSRVLRKNLESFYSCQLCPRKRCESRKAKYNEALAAKYRIKN